jgi:cysteine synthase A
VTALAAPRVLDSILAAIGNTPLVALDAILPPGLRARGVTIWGKAEHLNPGGSVKDRIALAMIEVAEADGRLQAGATIIEPTSGNTGIGLALVCRKKGYRLVLTMPESMSLERRSLLEALGAELVLTPAEQSMDGAVDKARALCASTPGAFMPQQFDNPANPSVHRRTTGPEIVAQLDEAGVVPAAFVAGVGTGGTISGVSPVLRARFPGVRVIAVEPAGSPVISGGASGPHKIQGIGAGFVPRNLDRHAFDEVRTVTDRDAWTMKRRLATECGLLLGISSGANVSVALAVAESLPGAAQIVTILCDTGERYFSLDEYFGKGP